MTYETGYCKPDTTDFSTRWVEGMRGVQLFFTYLWLVLTFGKYAPIRGKMATRSNLPMTEKVYGWYVNSPAHPILWHKNFSQIAMSSINPLCRVLFQMSVALVYAAEAYHTRGAMRHVVGDLQMLSRKAPRWWITGRPWSRTGLIPTRNMNTALNSKSKLAS